MPVAAMIGGTIDMALAAWGPLTIAGQSAAAVVAGAIVTCEALRLIPSPTPLIINTPIM